MDSEVLVHGVGYFAVLFVCEILFLYCEVLMRIYAILWCILFSYLDFHNAKQSGILHSVGWKLKDASKNSIRNFSFVRIEYLRTNRAMDTEYAVLRGLGVKDRFTVGVRTVSLSERSHTLAVGF